MNRVIELGAPSLTGKDCNDLVAEAFANAEYPLKVTIKNNMPRNVAFPEVDGLFLRHVADQQGSQTTVTIASHDLFQRFASSVEQVAELNGYKRALTLSATVNSGKPSDGLTVDQLKDALKAKGIAFLPNAKKSELADLLDNAPESTVVTDETNKANE